MHVREFHPHLGQAHPAGLCLVTERTAELLKTASFLPLLVRALVLRGLRDQFHISEQANATPYCPKTRNFLRRPTVMTQESAQTLFAFDRSAFCRRYRWNN